MRAKKVLGLIQAIVLTSCGGGSSDPLDLNSVVGEYEVNLADSVVKESCSVSLASVRETLDGITALSQTSTGLPQISVPSYRSLDGTVDGNVITASGSIPLGGMGASTVTTTWEYDGDKSFTVDYTYTEGFVGQTSGCEYRFSGTALGR